MHARTWLVEDDLAEARECATTELRDRIAERVQSLGGDFMLALTCARQAQVAARMAAEAMGHAKENSPWL